MSYDELVALVKAQSEAIIALQQNVIDLAALVNDTDRRMSRQATIFTESIVNLSNRTNDDGDWWKNGDGENRNA